jgi:hypothetical protein
MERGKAAALLAAAEAKPSTLRQVLVVRAAPATEPAPLDRAASAKRRTSARVSMPATPRPTK